MIDSLADAGIIVDAGILADDDRVTYVVLPGVKDRARGLAGVTITVYGMEGDEE